MRPHKLALISRQGTAMKHTRWVNFYPPCEGESPRFPWRTTSWFTRELADKNAKRGRLACIKVEFTAGDGLSEADQRTMAA